MDANKVICLAGDSPEQWPAGILVNEVGPAEYGNTGGFRMLHPVLSPNLTSSRPCPLAGLLCLCVLRHQLDTIENHTAASESLTVHNRLGKEFGYSDIQRSSCTFSRVLGRSAVHLCHPTGLLEASKAGCARMCGTGWIT